MNPQDVPYTRGLHRLTEHCSAWLVPDGTWGWSNAGLVTGVGESLLFDTLFDVPLATQMRDGMEPITRDHPIRTVVNSHANGDHWFGNELWSDVEVVASEATAEEMLTNGPDLIRGLMASPDAAGAFARQVFAPFDFSNLTATPPTRTFEKELVLDVGGTRVELVMLGPAHTAGDTILYVPQERVLYAADLLFIGGTPIVWRGPVSHWVAACEVMLGMDTDLIVPGHGPVTDEDGIRGMLDYLQWIEEEATKRHDRGMTPEEAVRDIALGRFAELDEHSRIAQNVLATYYELDPTMERVGAHEVYRRMAELEGLS